MAVPEECATEAVRQQVEGPAPPLEFTTAAHFAPNERKTDWRSLVRGMALGAVAALATYLIISRFLPTVPRAHFGPAGRVILLASVIVACAAAPLAHELGHVLGGMVVRFRFTMLAWGPFRVAREGKHIRIGRNRNINYIGGIALSLPRTPNPPAPPAGAEIVRG